MRFLLSATVSLFALGTAGVAAIQMHERADAAVAQQQGQNRDQGLCRRAPALPALGAEQDQYRGRSNYAGRRGAEPRIVPSPPPPPVMAPPPPAPMAPTMRAESSDVTVSGSSVRGRVSSGAARDEGGARPVAPPPPAAESGYYGRRPAPMQPQSGILTAAEHDDLLNPALYASYVHKYYRDQRQQFAGLPRLDTRNVLTVTVHDETGRPIPFAPVTLTCADGNRLTLTTMADGAVAFFPDIDRLGRSVRLSVRGAGERMVTFDGVGAQVQQMTVAGARSPGVRQFDLALVVDTTGSMGDEIAYLRSELRAILADLRRSHPQLDMRIALVAYRDIGDEYVTRTYRFSGSMDEMQGALARFEANGGGDYPEAMDGALHRAVALDWRPNAIRSLVLVADAPPHNQNMGRTWAVAEAARAQRIHITPVAASGVADEAEYIMRAMAAATQSRYLFLTDDSGVGNPHADPSVACYLVTRLDALMRRVLDSQVSGRRVEPRDGEVIRAVGDYDRGRCILPPDFNPEQ
jgi:hypothetical protein